MSDQRRDTRALTEARALLTIDDAVAHLMASPPSVSAADEIRAVLARPHLAAARDVLVTAGLGSCRPTLEALLEREARPPALRVVADLSPAGNPGGHVEAEEGET